MDAYTQHLLGMAVETVTEADATIGLRRMEIGFACALTRLGEPVQTFQRPTLAEALAALLTDLGVEVPERPSAERVAEMSASLANPLLILRDIYAREPLTVLALLEGGGS